jgi:hypothetical protein
MAAHTYVLSSWVFLRALGVIYLIAFISLARQVRGLIGSEGLVPAIDLLNRHRGGGLGRILRIPTLLWINSSDKFLGGLCWSGAILSVLMVLGIAPLPITIVLWICYLSLFTVGGPFLGYQWDILLLEAGFLAIFLAPLEWLPTFPPTVAPSPVVIVLLWWLLFRLMWSSGLTKILSGDRRWRKLSALAFHYETQPLPTPLAWHMHQLPLWFHRLSTAIVLVVEMIVPALIFVPGAAQSIAAGLFIALMICIELTGNYAFFNLLGIALCIPLFDDARLSKWLGIVRWQAPTPSTGCIVVSIVPAVLILILSLAPMLLLFHREVRWPGLLEKLIRFLTPFRLVNSYGLFSVMTIERPEIIVEASDNGADWVEYEFKYKPGNARRPSRFVAPHQPRLDWQMWFAAMGYYQNHLWIRRLMMRLMEGEACIEALLKLNPFQKSRPRYIRCVLFDYRFTSRKERKVTGAYWRRERRGLYAPVIEFGK